MAATFACPHRPNRLHRCGGGYGSAVAEQEPEPRDLLAVVPDDEAVERVRRKLADADVPPGAVAVDHEADRRVSLEAEMADEANAGWILPQAAFIADKRGTRGLVLVGAVACAAGVLFLSPFLFVDLGLSTWTRWILVLGIGITFGITIALVVGPALGAKRPSEPMAAQQGHVLRIPANDEAARAALADEAALRIDEVRGEAVTDNLVSSEDEPIVETAADLASNAAKGDDLHSGAQKAEDETEFDR
jgi:hypothetical protein